MNRPIYFEILSEQPVDILNFYKQVLGWEPATWEGPQTYWMITTGPEDTPGINGGVMERHFDQAVINTIEVESLDEMLDKVKNAGGEVVHGPNEVPEVGMHAYCADTEGILFGLMEPFENPG